MASHPAFGCDCVCRQLDPAHGASLPQKRLPQAARGRESAGRFAGSGRDSGADLSLPMHHPQRDEIAGGGREVQARTDRATHCDPQWAARDGEISGAVVRLLRGSRRFCGLPGRTHACPRNSVPGSVPRGRHCRLPGIRVRADSRLDLEGEDLGRDRKACFS